MLEIHTQNLQNSEVCFPGRTTSQYYSKHNSITTKAQKDYNLTNNFSSNQTHSFTQRQILSHSLINQIVQKSKQKTVQHHINMIPIQTKLFALPLEHEVNQFQFDAIPPTNDNYVSTASQKIKQFHERLSDNRSLSQRLQELADKNKTQYVQYKKRKASVDENVNRRVSISGLVSYDFNSVSARKTLGCIPDIPQELALVKKKIQIKRRNSCSVDRQANIIKRKPNIYNMKKLQMAKAAICDFHTPTDKFLKSFRSQMQKKDYIYGQRMQKLNCIKQYMQKQRSDYDQAQFIVQAVINSQKKQKVQKPAKPKIVFDQQVELSKRRQAVSRKRVMLKNLYFVD